MISILIKTENILGIYRNYNIFKTRDKIMILLRSVIELLIPLIILAKFTVIVFEVNDSSEMLKLYVTLFHVVYFFNNTACFVSGIYYSSSYQTFVTNLTAVQHSLHNESIYIGRMKKLKTFFIIVLFVIILSSLGRAILTLIEYSVVLKRDFWPHDVWLTLLLTYVEIRFLTEHLVLLIHITMIKHLLKCLNTSILNKQTKYSRTGMILNLDTQNKKSNLTIQSIKEWAAKFNCLKRCAEELTLCFKYQVRLQTVAFKIFV